MLYNYCKSACFQTFLLKETESTDVKNLPQTILIFKNRMFINNNPIALNTPFKFLETSWNIKLRTILNYTRFHKMKIDFQNV